MKAILISIQPKWRELIASGKKTIEVRKTRPKMDEPFLCYIYETQGLYHGSGGCLFNGRGKVIGEFVLDDLLEIENLGSSFRVKGDKDGRLTNMTASASVPKSRKHRCLLTTALTTSSANSRKSWVTTSTFWRSELLSRE